MEVQSLIERKLVGKFKLLILEAQNPCVIYDVFKFLQFMMKVVPWGGAKGFFVNKLFAVDNLSILIKTLRIICPFLNLVMRHVAHAE